VEFQSTPCSQRPAKGPYAGKNEHVHFATTYFSLSFFLNIFLPFMPSLLNYCLFLQVFMINSSHRCHAVMPRQTLMQLLYNQSNTLRSIPIMKLLFLSFAPSPLQILCVRPEHSPQHPLPTETPYI
jgi:hypothetical protein